MVCIATKRPTPTSHHQIGQLRVDLVRRPISSLSSHLHSNADLGIFALCRKVLPNYDFWCGLCSQSPSDGKQEMGCLSLGQPLPWRSVLLLGTVPVPVPMKPQTHAREYDDEQGCKATYGLPEWTMRRDRDMPSLPWYEGQKKNLLCPLGIVTQLTNRDVERLQPRSGTTPNFAYTLALLLAFFFFFSESSGLQKYMALEFRFAFYPFRYAFRPRYAQLSRHGGRVSDPRLLREDLLLSWTTPILWRKHGLCFTIRNSHLPNERVHDAKYEIDTKQLYSYPET